MHVVDTTMFYASEGGGVGRYLSAKHEWLQRHTTIKHTIVAPGPADGIAPGGMVTVASPTMPGLQGYRFPLRLGRWKRRLITLSPDVIEVGDPYGPAWAALHAGQALGIPVMAFYHSDLVRLVSTRLGRWTEPLLRRYVHSLYREFDLVMAPSRAIQAKLAALGVDRLVCQPLGVDTSLFNPKRASAALREELNLPPRTRLLVFAGRFAREKNLPILFEAFRLLGSRYHLLLIGSGMHLPPQANVTVYPYQSKGEELARLMASSDALVHAGDQETFGLVVLEAMACGVPVIAANAGALAELVTVDTGMLVRPRDAQALAEAISGLYDRNIEQLGRQARHRVETHYSWDTILRSMTVCYAQLAAAGPAAALQTYAAR
jgi:alpha-1,6-mannosyltransferase